MPGESQLNEIFNGDSLIKELQKAGVSQELLDKVKGRLVDHLTGLPKAETCQSVVQQYIQEGRKVTVEFDDLRFLKIFNDTIGAERTNDLLKTIGGIYKTQAEKLRSEHAEVVVGRYAGDSFLIILPDVSSDKASDILEDFHRELKKLEQPEGAPFKPHFSRGLANTDELTENERNYSKLIELSDQRARKDKGSKWKAIKERAKGNAPTEAFVKKIQRYG